MELLTISTLILSFIFSHLAFVHLFLQSHIISFNKTTYELDIQPQHDLLLICPYSHCQWKIPELVKTIVNFNTTTNQLKITNNKEMYGNYTVCYNSSNLSSIEFYKRPSCCPCCQWYQMSSCKSNFNSNICTTIIVYYKWITMPMNNRFNFIDTFNNTMILLPCKMRLAGFKDNLKILDLLDNDSILIQFKNGSMTDKDKNFRYNPSVGLCLNTRFLKLISMIDCKYESDNITRKFAIQQRPLFSQSLINKFSLSNGLKILPETGYLNIMTDEDFTISCETRIKGTKFKDVIICMELYYNKANKPFFQCSNKTNIQNLTIYAKDLINNTRITCNSVDGSRFLRQTIQLILQTHNHSSLTLTNLQSYNRYHLKIYENSSSYSFRIYYKLISKSNWINCEFVGPFILKHEVSCQVEFVGVCSCLINLRNNFIDFINHTIFVKVHNVNFSRLANISVIPTYLHSPNINGLTSKLESVKTIYCNASVSPPYQVLWKFEFDNKYFYDKVTLNSLIFQLPIHKNLSIICASCQVKNEIGTKGSNKRCQTLLDFQINSMKTLQIFIQDATIWQNGIIETSMLNFTKSSNKNFINILDMNMLIIKCVSKLKSGDIEIGLNDQNLSRNSMDFVSKYTKQSTLKLKLKNFTNTNYSGIFYCKQYLANGTVLVDNSSFINILNTLTPQFQSKGIKKYKYFPVHIFVLINSFPKPNFALYKKEQDIWNPINANGSKIFSIYEKSQNQYELTLQFINASKHDNGVYLLVASNIKGNDSLTFVLELLNNATSGFSVKIIIMSIIIIIIVIIISVILFKLFRKSGYAVPIIQIQNSLYKSIDSDSFQLVVNIWPDANDRAKWIIKSENQIKLMEKIGGGNYGQIYLGSCLMNHCKQPKLVALKQPLTSKNINSKCPDSLSQFSQISIDCFINEVKILTKLTNCSNIIHMYGCTIQTIKTEDEKCSFEPYNTTLLVLEYCSNRSLNEFLKNNAVYFSLNPKSQILSINNDLSDMKIDEVLTLLDLKNISLGIAMGLEHLSNLNIIHRDLAARNILISTNKVPKISDFGLAIELDNYSNETGTSYQILTLNKALPYKILPPEALEMKLFYLESDIWSFSLLLWEIFNLANCVLFPHLKSPYELLRFIQSRLSLKNEENCDLLNIPKYADQSIWNLIQSCWFIDPFKRPSAQILKNKLMEIIQESPEVTRINNVNSDNECRTRLSSSSSTVITSTTNLPLTSLSNMSNTNPYLASVCSNRLPESSNSSEITLNYPNCINNNSNPFYKSNCNSNILHINSNGFRSHELIDESLM